MLVILLITLALIIKQKNKRTLIILGIFGGLFGLVIEIIGISKNSWHWSNISGVSGVPYLTILAYGLGALLIAILYQHQNFKQWVMNENGRFEWYLILFGIGYLFFARDFMFLTFALGLHLYNKFNKESYILRLAALFAMFDIIGENVLMALGVLTYTWSYNAGVYMGIFVGAFFFASLAQYLLNKK